MGHIFLSKVEQGFVNERGVYTRIADFLGLLNRLKAFLRFRLPALCRTLVLDEMDLFRLTVDERNAVRASAG
jgi:hypothetical protein